MTEILPTDSGPIYKETHMGRWPVEPWNTWSTLLFLFFVIYWLWILRDSWKDHKIILTTTLLTGTGFIGGFIYHSTRSHLFWLLLDWGPIVINANILALTLWMWTKNNWKVAIVATYIPIVCSIPLYLYSRFTSILSSSLGYIALICATAPPLILWCQKTKFKYISFLMMALMSVTSAILLRTFDKHEVMSLFPMGTHFLWHILGALTFQFITIYIFKTQKLVNTRTPS